MKITKSIKKNLYKLEHVDKNKSRLFIVLSFILAFTLFTGITYSEFVINKEMNAINIKIADLNYTLFNDDTNGSSNIIIGKNETKIVNFTLTSKNNIPSKYALIYKTDNKDIDVYYSYNQRNNMSGLIGTDGASITMRVVIINPTNDSATIDFTIESGYETKEDISSNIVEGYYEEQLVKRTILLDENFENAVETAGNPSIDSDYLYFDTICTEDATITWNTNKNDIDIETEANSIACDIYFKKATKPDIELIYRVNSPDLTIINEGNIDYTRYNYVSSHCNNDAIIKFDNETHEVVVTNITSKTLCVVNLKENNR